MGTILVVGDSAGRETLRDLLAGQGYALTFAGGTPQALEHVPRQIPDLIFLDVPDAHTTSLCRVLRGTSDLALVPILVAGAPGEPDPRLELLQAGADDFVGRPLDAVEVQARVRALIRLNSTRQLYTLQSAGAAITSSLDLQAVLNTVTQEMVRLLDMKACAILQWDHTAHTLSLLARYGPDAWWAGRWSPGAHNLADLPSTERVLLERRAQQITPEVSPADPQEAAYMQRTGLRVLLKLPMIFQERVVGLVEVLDDQAERRLTSNDVSLAQLLANQAASALENARLYRAVRRHLAELTTLNHISQVITAILDLRETLSIIADHVHWLLDVAAASVILYDQDSDRLWFGATSGESSRFIQGRHLSPGQGVVAWVIEHGEPLRVNDAPQDPRFFDDWDQATGFTTHSVLCAPLRARGRTIGAIEAINKASGPFDQKDLTLLTSIAASAAIAIDNARLYEQAQQEIDEKRQVELELRKVNRALRTLIQCNETLARAEAETTLMEDICCILVEQGGYRLAWVGYAEHDPARQVRPVAWAGYEAGYLADLDLTWADAERERGPTGMAIRTGQPALVRDILADPGFAPWRDGALRRGYASSIALPLNAGGHTLGALNIYAGEPDAFDTQEVALLAELANDLAFGVMALRTRAERDRAEEEIRHLYRELQHHADSLEETVTERTHQLEAERDRTQAILEAVGEAVIVTDLHGRIQYLNQAAVTLTGYTLEEAVGRSPRFWQQDQQEAGAYPPEAEARAASTRPGAVQAQRAEVVSRRKDGSLYDSLMTVAPLFDAHEPRRLVGHVCVQRDITPIKEAERLKDQFVSNVSHELRTPLSVIALVSGNLDRLYDRLADDKRRKMVRDIREHAQVLDDLIGDVLEISRIESGRISMERQAVDLAALARDEAEVQRPLAQRKAQVLHVTGAERLPIWANKDQVRQVIRNLLNNAIKYTPDRGQITCDCAALASGSSRAAGTAPWPDSAALPPGRWAALRVTDTGFGISPEDLLHVFERFYRVKTQGNIPGTGLGLSIVKELIEAHGGQIAVTSTPGEGSVFAVYLPLLEE